MFRAREASRQGAHHGAKKSRTRMWFSRTPKVVCFAATVSSVGCVGEPKERCTSGIWSHSLPCGLSSLNTELEKNNRPSEPIAVTSALFQSTTSAPSSCCLLAGRASGRTDSSGKGRSRFHPRDETALVFPEERARERHVWFH